MQLTSLFSVNQQRCLVHNMIMYCSHQMSWALPHGNTCRIVVAARKMLYYS